MIMKKILFAACTMLSILPCAAQSNFKEKTVFKNNDVEFRQIDEHTWHGNGTLVFNESVYLIEGEKSAILIDAGTRIPGLKKIAEEKPGFIRAMWCGDRACEDTIKEKLSVTSRCMPFAQEEISDTCVCCGKPAKKMVYWGRAY